MVQRLRLVTINLDLEVLVVLWEPVMCHPVSIESIAAFPPFDTSKGKAQVLNFVWDISTQEPAVIFCPTCLIWHTKVKIIHIKWAAVSNANASAMISEIAKQQQEQEQIKGGSDTSRYYAVG